MRFGSISQSETSISATRGIGKPKEQAEAVNEVIGMNAYIFCGFVLKFGRIAMAVIRAQSNGAPPRSRRRCWTAKMQVFHAPRSWILLMPRAHLTSVHRTIAHRFG
jgi:hypothetical protein